MEDSIKQLCHLRSLNVKLVMANSALRASLVIHHLVSNASLKNIFKLFFVLFRPTLYKTSPSRSFLQWHVFRKVLNQPNLGCVFTLASHLPCSLLFGQHCLSEFDRWSRIASCTFQVVGRTFQVASVNASCAF